MSGDIAAPGSGGDGTLQVTLTACQPLAVGVTSEVGYVTESHPYVPGSVLRGALAAAWIAEYGPPDQCDPADAARFRLLFDSGVRYGPLLPAGSRRVPMSVYRCKYPRDLACRGFVDDRAFGSEPAKTCPSCDGPLMPGKGTLELPPGLRLTRTTRTSIDGRTGTAKDQELYARGALPVGTRLEGSIWPGPQPLPGWAVDWLTADRAVRVGGRRTVGGQAGYTAAVASTADPVVNTDRLVLRLTSPAVFVDAAGRPAPEPLPEVDLAGTGVTVTRRWVRTGTWSGWHAASHLPKPADLCAEAGSTYLLTGAPAALAAFGRRAVRYGLGLRRDEGFGVAKVCTEAWQPTVSGEEHPSGPTDLAKWVCELKLRDYELRWLLGVMRDVQGVCPEGQPVPLTVVEELLKQPTGAKLSGRQKDSISAALATELTVQQLRDVISVVEHRRADYHVREGNR